MKKVMKFEVWQHTESRLWHWQLRAVNNRIIAVCYEGSLRKPKMLNTIRALQIGSVIADVVDIPDPREERANVQQTVNHRKPGARIRPGSKRAGKLRSS